jgi:hypothetical protein
MNAAAFVTALAQRGAGVKRGEMPTLHHPDAWSTVLDLATEHRVAPLVWEALSDAASAVPPPIGAAFEKQLFQSSATSMLCENALQGLMTMLALCGVDVLVLKGPSIAHSVYPRPQLRTYNDLDVLCRSTDYPKLRRALLAGGYAAVPFEPMGPSDGSHETLKPKPSPMESHSVRGFYDSSADVKFEVHFDLLQFGLRDRNCEEFWRRSRTLKAGPIQIPVLSPEHQFLHLAAHVQRHSFSRLGWLIDIDLLVRQQLERLDWSSIVQLARDEGMGAVVRHVLEIAHSVLDTPMPRLPPSTLEERCLAVCYRRLWPLTNVRRLGRHERKRLVRFMPDSTDRRNVAYGFILLGRRREKLQILRLHHGRTARG